MMKQTYLLLATCLCLWACKSTSPLDDQGGGDPLRAADGSSSRISEKQALVIARKEIAKREGWPEPKIDSHHLVHTVYYGSHRIDHGGWRVVAHRAVAEDRPGGALGYDPIPAVIMIINERGSVTHYIRKDTNE
jgi:hypothetical protein